MWTALVPDLFTRTHESWHDHLGGLPPGMLLARPGPEANPVGWIAWHALRVQDDHLADLVSGTQVWHQGWADRFSLPYDRDAIGYGQSTEEVGHFQADSALLLGYADAVHARTLEIVAQLGDDDPERIVDERWDPPVTLGVRLVSVVNDVTQHVGQVGYALGILATH
ncbi:mycothiol transferase [Nocardioides campestrisoli]|uniref:mycothiol transferase n=1 Tax=Nocardioides campestrisoli TaxID=2736757 RepID=UPI0015E62EC3|nr:DinB family protein [Nocardioides campestrisoli]